MNIKKLVVTGATVALLFGSAAGAFASSHHGSSTTVKNYGDIENTSVNVANTGLNYGGGHHGSVKTGDASAWQSTTNVISTSSDCGCSKHGGKTEVTNHGDIENQSWNVANSGLNAGGKVHTGDASAGQDVTNVVNTSVGSN